MPWFLLFLIVPIVEIAIFVVLGGTIGFWPTMLGILVTAIIGTFLVRSQGLAVIGRLRETLERGGDPSGALADGAMILVSGALLLTPGYLTDTIGFLLLVPGIRTSIYRWIKARVKVVNLNARQTATADSSIIDGEYQDITGQPRPNGPSGWTRD